MGRLVKDPEQKFTDGGTEKSTFVLAVNRRFVKQGEERQKKEKKRTEHQ